MDESDEQHTTEDDLTDSGETDDKSNGNEESHDQDTTSHDQDIESHDDDGGSHDQQGVLNVAIAPLRHKPGALSPYSVPCVRELLRFLTSIMNAAERWVVLFSLEGC